MNLPITADLPGAASDVTSDLKVEAIPIRWSPDLPIYACEAFLKYSGNEYGWLGGFDDNGEIRCVLPYTIIVKGFLRMARFRVETLFKGHPISPGQEKRFLNKVMTYLRSSECDLVVPAPPNTIFRTVPDGAVAAPYGSYVVDLTVSEETRWNKLHSKHRNAIRSARKKGVQIKAGVEYADAAYRLIRRTLKRSRLGFLSTKSFKRLLAALEGNISVVVAEQGGVLQGCAVIPYSAHSAYYLYGGSSDTPASGAMNLLQWEAMRHFSELGTKRYDFVGTRIDPDKDSKQRGLQMFKERFGGRLLQGYLWKYPFRRWKYACYQIAVRGLRGGDIVDKERHRLPSSGFDAETSNEV